MANNNIEHILNKTSRVVNTQREEDSSLEEGSSSDIPLRAGRTSKKPSRCRFCNVFGKMNAQGLRRHTFRTHYHAITLLDKPEYAIAQYEIGSQIGGQAGEYMKYRAFYNLLKKLGAVDDLPPFIQIGDLKAKTDIRALAVGDIPIREEVLKPVEEPVPVESQPPLVTESEEDLFALLTAPLPSAAELPSDIFDKDFLLDMPDDEFSSLEFTDPVEPSHSDFEEPGSDFENHCDEFHKD